MDNIKNDSYYIGKITENIDFIIAHTANVNIDDFSSDEVLQDSMMFRLIQISENSIKLSEEYKESRKDIPWRSISGLRNRIVHDYGNVDFRVVFDTLTKDIPDLKVLFAK